MNPFPHFLIRDILTGREIRFPDTTAWPAFLDRVFKEQVQGIAYQHLKGSAVVPERVMDRLAQAYYAAFAANTRCLKAIEELALPLAAEELFVMVIKGAALLDRFYADPGLRPMEDMDLLVDPGDFSSLKRVLIGCGYAVDAAFPHMFHRQGILIDVHTSLLHTDRIAARKGLLSKPMSRIWEDSRPWAPDSPFIRRPDDTDHMIILAHHMIKHSFSKLIWLVDVLRLIEDQDRDFWDRLERKISIYRQKRPVAYILYLLDRIFGIRPPETSGMRFYQQWIAGFDRFVLNIRVRGGFIGDLGNLLWLFCLQGATQRFYFLQETMIPSKKVLLRETSNAGGRMNSAVYRYRWALVARRVLQNFRIIVKAMLRFNPSSE